MKAKRNKGSGVAYAVLTGEIVAVVLTLLASVVSSSMLNKSVVDEASLKMIVTGTHFLSMLTGTWMAGVLSGRKVFACIAVSSVYFLLLALVGVFVLGGQLENVIRCLVTVTLGTGAGLSLSFYGKKQRTTKRRKVYSR